MSLSVHSGLVVPALRACPAGVPSIVPATSLHTTSATARLKTTKQLRSGRVGSAWEFEIPGIV
jgi:hypothetical protein